MSTGSSEHGTPSNRPSDAPTARSLAVGYDEDLDYLRDQADSGDDVTHEDVDIFEDVYNRHPASGRKTYGTTG
jgi:hypothetical protein